MIKYLLDTNIVIYVLKRRPLEVLETFNKNANRMAISSITLSELLYGAEKSANVHKNLEAIDLAIRRKGIAALRSHQGNVGKER